MAKLARFMTKLLESGVHVAVVTAAGYGEDPTRYEERLSGLLSAFTERAISADAVSRFHVCGGESNFLFNCERTDDGSGRVRLVHVPLDRHDAAYTEGKDKPKASGTVRQKTTRHDC